MDEMILDMCCPQELGTNLCDITSCTQKAYILTLDPMALGKSSPRIPESFDTQLVTPRLNGS